MRWLPRPLVLIPVALFWLAIPAPTFAHAVIVRSDPAGACLSVAASVPLPGDSRCVVVGTEGIPLGQSPTAVRVWFSEPVEPFGDGLWVIGPNAARVDRPPLRLSPTALGVDVDAAQPGTYLVHWQIVAADTHPARGSFTFIVGQPGGVLATIGGDVRTDAGAVAPIGLALAVAARWLHFLGYALGFGVLAFRLFIFLPAAQSLKYQSEEVTNRLWRLVNLGIVLLVVAEPIGLLGQTGSLGSDAMFNPDIVSAALDSSFGRAMAVRLSVPFLLWVLIGIARGGTETAVGVALGVAVGAGFLDGISAHARGVQPVWLGLVVNTLHVVAMGSWVGGLAAMVAVWPRIQGKSDGKLREIVHGRFGRVATVSVAILIASGILLAGSHLGGLADLRATTYGAVVAGKAGLVTLILILVGLSLRTRRRPTHYGWILEGAGLAIVLALAGVLVSLPPPV